MATDSKDNCEGSRTEKEIAWSGYRAPEMSNNETCCTHPMTKKLTKKIVNKTTRALVTRGGGWW